MNWIIGYFCLSLAATLLMIAFFMGAGGDDE